MYYQSAQEFCPDRPESRALWVLVSIYHGLLKRIEKANYDVFSAAPRAIRKKLAILVVA